MAARAQEPARLDILDLRHFRAQDLTTLLDEEARIWAGQLRWDFTASSELVRRYLDQRALAGFALVAGSAPVGYTYYVHEEHKALVGDLFVSAAFRTPEAEHALLRHIIQQIRRVPSVRRVEAQLMMIESPAAASQFPAAEVVTFERNFMLAEGIRRMPRALFGPQPDPAMAFEPFTDRHVDAAAYLIARSYVGHIDSQINDQYESVAGARRFLNNITQYPGCGAFHAPAAMVAIDSAEGDLCGVSLTSLVGYGVGHITQVCVSSHKRNRGIGAELLWRSAQVFCRAGCDAISLTVTAANTGAVRLYQRIGFRTLRRFRAFVWRGWR